MKGMRSLFRLGTLAVIASLLVVALTVPSVAAESTCPAGRKYDAVEILDVTSADAPMEWSARTLLYFGDGAANTYAAGQLSVRFKDINDAHDFYGYEITATPAEGTSDPGVSEALGVKEKTEYVARPSQVGSTVTYPMNLEPGTRYDIKIRAVSIIGRIEGSNFEPTIISDDPRTNDIRSGETLLSPPFLGAFITDATKAEIDDPETEGSHYIVYKGDGEHHEFRWLNPAIFGPFDHVWKPGKVSEEGADLLCMQDNGDLDDDCTGDDIEGITHYRLTVRDADNISNVAFRDTFAEKSNIPVAGSVSNNQVPAVFTPARTDDDLYYKANFNLQDGEYWFEVEAVHVDGRKVTPLSNKAVVKIEIPGDLRVYDQSYAQYLDLLEEEVIDHITDDADNSEAWRNSIWNYNARSKNYFSTESTVNPTDGTNDGGIGDEESFEEKNEDPVRNLTAFLNNLYH